MRTTLALLIGAATTLAACAPKTNGPTSQPDAVAASQPDDHSQIQASISTMDEYDPADMQKRIELVLELGIADRDGKSGPQVGDEAPDFALQPLRIYDFQLNDESTELEGAGALFEPVRLSSFEGSLPVVLIFGSYT